MLALLEWGVAPRQRRPSSPGLTWLDRAIQYSRAGAL